MCFFTSRVSKIELRNEKNIKCKGLKLNDFSQVTQAHCNPRHVTAVLRTLQQEISKTFSSPLKFSSFLCAVPSLPLISSFWWSSINWVSQKQPMTTLLINGHFMGLEMSSNLQSKELTELKRSLTFNMWCKIRYGGSIDFLLDKVARASRWVWPAPS